MVAREHISIKNKIFAHILLQKFENYGYNECNFVMILFFAFNESVPVKTNKKL